jgi:hypothetical protein
MDQLCIQYLLHRLTIHIAAADNDADVTFWINGTA